MINLTTGPVDITAEVIEALNSPVIAHRSAGCVRMHEAVTDALCRHMSARNTFLMTGSGTMANDCMLYQIRALRTKGLILINGEFGSRLKKQAERLQINFETYELPWGTPFDRETLSALLKEHHAAWILCCHCETSTGQVIDPDMLRALHHSHNVSVFLDCMSTFGTMDISLRDIAMATASTAKGIGSLSGLAMVFSNIPILEQADVPLYLDLHHVQSCKGIPFTISSNLIAGLHAALHLNNRRAYWNRLDAFSTKIRERLAVHNLLPFADHRSRVFTLQPEHCAAGALGEFLKASGISTSYESQYLRQRNWLQLALFSVYTDDEIEYVLTTIERFLISG